MDAIAWLERNAVGFTDLQPEDRAAAMHFSLLWSYFEAEALNANGSSNAIRLWVQDLHDRGKLDPDAFSSAINYIKDRYFKNGQFTDHFNKLNLRDNDRRDMIKAVLSGNNPDLVDTVASLFIIIYRFRNNYFHGSKWVYNLRGQGPNFTMAIDSIMTAMDMWRK